MLKAGSSRPIQKLQIQKHHERADDRYSETKALQHAHTLALERYLEAVRDKMANCMPTVKLSPPARQQLWHEITGFLEASKILSTVDAK